MTRQPNREIVSFSRPQRLTISQLLLENAANLFERANKVPEAQIEAEAKQEMLLQEVGQLQIENRFLKKKYKQLYGHEPKL